MNAIYSSVLSIESAIVAVLNFLNNEDSDTQISVVNKADSANQISQSDQHPSKIRHKNNSDKGCPLRLTSLHEVIILFCPSSDVLMYCCTATYKDDVQTLVSLRFLTLSLRFCRPLLHWSVAKNSLYTCIFISTKAFSFISLSQPCCTTLRTSMPHDRLTTRKSRVITVGKSSNFWPDILNRHIDGHAKVSAALAKLIYSFLSGHKKRPCKKHQAGMARQGDTLGPMEKAIVHRVVHLIEHQ